MQPSCARVLIVDDEPQIARSMMRILRGHEVTLVSSGQEALAACDAQDYDVIFCDLMMPGMTGMDVHSQLAKQRPGAEERIVFMSGGAFTSRGQDFLRRVPNRRIDKPFEIEQVRAIVKRCIPARSSEEELNRTTP